MEKPVDALLSVLARFQMKYGSGEFGRNRPPGTPVREAPKALRERLSGLRASDFRDLRLEDVRAWIRPGENKMRDLLRRSMFDMDLLREVNLDEDDI